ncbi:MAG: hypothetical protein ACFB51_02780, partial [Anaerolineae bacterium]
CGCAVGITVYLVVSTLDWVPGESLVDERSFRLAQDVEPGIYELELGWYNEADASRLNIIAEEGHIIDNWLMLHTILVQDNPQLR